MTKYISSISFFFIAFLLLPTSCKKSDLDGPIQLGSRVCFKTAHHERGLTDVSVYLKLHTTEWPGYDDLSQFDTMLVSDSYADVCFPVVPVGNHWVIGIGYDSLLHEPVRGGLPFEIVSWTQPWDTILYISEF